MSVEVVPISRISEVVDIICGDNTDIDIINSDNIGTISA